MGCKVGVQGQCCLVGLVDDYIFVLQLVNFFKIGMGWFVRGIEFEGQVDFVCQQFGQCWVVGQIMEFKLQFGCFMLQVVYQCWKDVECGEIGDCNLYVVGVGGWYKCCWWCQFLVEKFQC